MNGDPFAASLLQGAGQGALLLPYAAPRIGLFSRHFLQRGGRDSNPTNQSNSAPFAADHGYERDVVVAPTADNPATAGDRIDSGSESAANVAAMSVGI
jgi:hypothetical protein